MSWWGFIYLGDEGNIFNWTGESYLYYLLACRHTQQHVTVFTHLINSVSLSLSSYSPSSITHIFLSFILLFLLPFLISIYYPRHLSLHLSLLISLPSSPSSLPSSSSSLPPLPSHLDGNSSRLLTPLFSFLRWMVSAEADVRVRVARWLVRGTGTLEQKKR